MRIDTSAAPFVVMPVTGLSHSASLRWSAIKETTT